MAEYLTARGEVLDQIVLAHYGRNDVIVAVLDANPGLADQGPILPYRTRVVLPEIAGSAETAVLRLWGAS